MPPAPIPARSSRGFTLIELMIVVAIIGLLAAIAIPNFLRFQLKAKTTEARSNLAAIRTAEKSYYNEKGLFVPALSVPSMTPGSRKAPFANGAGTAPGFDELGWSPEGGVYFAYAVSAATTAPAAGFFAAAVGDLDANGEYQGWGYRLQGSSGGPGATGAGGATVPPPGDLDLICPPIPPDQVLPCTAASGTSVF